MRLFDKNKKECEMKKIISNSSIKTILLFAFLILQCSQNVFAQTQTESTYSLNVNRINFPVRSNGVLGASYKDNLTDAIIFDGVRVVWSAGFLLSGYSNGNLWSNGVASAARIEDYKCCIVEDGESEMYVLKSTDQVFGDSWQNWKTAVTKGAYYYDGNGDGVYDPIDLNSNGIWDSNEDRPDLLGDETVWCVYSDALPSLDDVTPQSIEIRQTVWAYAGEGEEGNVVYVRYSILNKGTIATKLDSVYFGVWSDTDIGNYIDDLGGTDLELNSVFVYNDSTDSQLESKSMAHYISLLQRPWVETNSPNDFAFNNLGDHLGVDTIYGAKNLKMTSSNQILKYVAEHEDPKTKSMVRNILEGHTSLNGNIIDPCNWEYGFVNEVNCEDIEPNFIYSGDPQTNIGWINNNPTDTRMLANVGPFSLNVDEPQDIIVSHVLATDSDHLSSLAKTKSIVNNIISRFPTDINNSDKKLTIRDYKLYQNYPNPFNPSTIISYSVPKQTHVKITVFDILGNKIATLFEGIRTTGNYEVEFTPKNSFSSGIYFYQIITPEYSKTNKMMLLK